MPHRMYTWKHNCIQIMPKYRKEFRGANAVLHIIEKEKIVLLRGGGYFFFDGTKEEFEEEKYWRPYSYHRLSNRYDYYLEVKDPRLQGKINGKYHNSTTDLTATKRKLKRLLRCRKLEIVDHTT